MGSRNEEKIIAEEDVKKIIDKCGYAHEDLMFEYYLENASDKMLGFLADYWRLKIHVTNDKTDSRKVLSFFIKAISRTNESKAIMVKELNLFQNEVFFYSVIKKKLEISDLKPWCCDMVAVINDDVMVFEDLAALQFQSRHKHERFDMAHTLQALSTLARLHAASIICEEKNSMLLQRNYNLYHDYVQFIEEKGYAKINSWFLQCMKGALEAVQSFSKYHKNKKAMNKIERNWENIWFSALDLTEFSTKYRNVISHRDLWNNNIMFHYKQIGHEMEPDDCVFVDFQAFRYCPPAGDVMLLLYCNLDPTFRTNNLNLFVNYYYGELSTILAKHGIDVNNIIEKQDFLTSVEEQKKWGLITCACLIPQFWVNDELTTKTFSDTDQFNKILSENKGEFIVKLMQSDPDYRDKVMEIFEEIIEQYCISGVNL